MDHSLLRKTQNTEKIGHFLKIVIDFDQCLNKKECWSNDIITFHNVKTFSIFGYGP